MQLERQIKSSIILENKLLKRENKKLCSGCKEIFLIDDLANGGFTCKKCNAEQNKVYRGKNNEKLKENKKEYMKEYYEKNKGKIKEHMRKYQREYRLKKKLEMQNNT